jgi:fumarate reductase subunit D
MISEPHLRPGFIAALLHRFSGIALAIFLPVHFLALASALDGADGLDRLLTVMNDPFVKLAETGLVLALAMHLALGLRVLAIEFLGVRERTGSAVSACVGVALIFGLAFLLNAA